MLTKLSYLNLTYKNIMLLSYCKMKKILLVEDDNDIIELLQDILSEKFEVSSEKNLNDLFQRSDIDTFDLIITDYLINNSTADEIIKTFKNKKIIIISALSLNSEKISLLVDNKKIFFIQKPFLIDSFVEIVEKVIS